MSHTHLFYLIFLVDRLSVAVVCGCCSWNPSDKKVIHRVSENNKKSTLEGLISVIKVLKKIISLQDGDCLIVGGVVLSE